MSTGYIECATMSTETRWHVLLVFVETHKKHSRRLRRSPSLLVYLCIVRDLRKETQHKVDVNSVYRVSD